MMTPDQVQTPYQRLIPAKRPRLADAEDDSHNSSASQPATPGNAPSSSKRVARSKPKIDASMSLEEAYPGLFISLTRANVLKVFKDPLLKSGVVTYPWRENIPAISNEQYLAMKARVSDDVAKHFISFGTARAGCWAIRARFPSLDCSSKVFGNLRRYFNRAIADLKHEFLYDRLFTYLHLARSQYPEIIDMNELELIQFLGPRFDVPLTKLLWGKCTRVLDINRTFADHEAPGSWYMRQVFLNMSIKVLRLIGREIALNPNLQWGKTIRAPSGWVADKECREDTNRLFDAFCIAPEFKDIELDSFHWAANPAA